jgi:hypothetical protein
MPEVRNFMYRMASGWSIFVAETVCFLCSVSLRMNSPFMRGFLVIFQFLCRGANRWVILRGNLLNYLRNAGNVRQQETYDSGRTHTQRLASINASICLYLLVPFFLLHFSMTNSKQDKQVIPFLFTLTEYVPVNNVK